MSFGQKLMNNVITCGQQLTTQSNPIQFMDESNPCPTLALNVLVFVKNFVFTRFGK